MNIFCAVKSQIQSFNKTIKCRSFIFDVCLISIFGVSIGDYNQSYVMT